MNPCPFCQTLPHLFLFIPPLPNILFINFPISAAKSASLVSRHQLLPPTHFAAEILIQGGGEAKWTINNRK